MEGKASLSQTPWQQLIPPSGDKHHTLNTFAISNIHLLGASSLLNSHFFPATVVGPEEVAALDQLYCLEASNKTSTHDHSWFSIFQQTSLCFAEMEVQLSKLDFFHKLGYSKEAVCKVLDKLGQGASDNDLLQELIQMGSRPQEPQQWTPPKPVAHKARRAWPTFRRPTEEASEPSSDLRPIVIDGSNVAMRQASFHSLVAYCVFIVFGGKPEIILTLRNINGNLRTGKGEGNTLWCSDIED